VFGLEDTDLQGMRGIETLAVTEIATVAAKWTEKSPRSVSIASLHLVQKMSTLSSYCVYAQHRSSVWEDFYRMTSSLSEAAEEAHSHDVSSVA